MSTPTTTPTAPRSTDAATDATATAQPAAPNSVPNPSFEDGLRALHEQYVEAVNHAVAEERYDLLWARLRGRWHRWGRLVLGERQDGDPLVSLDPVANPFPALEHPAWVRRLREPAYARARRSRART